MTKVKIGNKRRVKPEKGSKAGLAQSRKYSYPAFHFSQHSVDGPKLVVFYAPVGEVLAWAEVGELSPRKTGPQRERKTAKVTAIKKFLAADKKNIIPTAVVVAFSEGSAVYEIDESGVGTLGVTIGKKLAANIVDGQHRLYGINEFSPLAKVALVGLLEADEVEKAFQFLVINNKSSRVPATHTKALLARMQSTSLAKRLRVARISFEAEGIKDVDLVNSDRDSPFFQTIAWTTTPQETRMVQATAIEASLEYMGGLGISEFEDRDVRRSVFLTIWNTIKGHWPSLWKPRMRLVNKVSIVCLTRFIADTITKWADSEELDIDLTDLDEIKEQTTKIISRMDKRFWTASWAEGAGGFDTHQGRDRVVKALQQLYRNGKNSEQWNTDIDIIAGARADDGDTETSQ
jgi:DGQHR domain-containing protein